METVMTLAGMTAVTGLSLWLALGLTRLCLRGVLRLLPAMGAQAGQRLRVIPGAAARAPKTRLARARVSV